MTRCFFGWFSIWLRTRSNTRPRGGKIEVTLEQQDGSAVLQVKDNGPGIAADAQEHIFDRFYRGDPAREGSGTGLGLALVRSIVELHHGQISRVQRAWRGKLFSRDFAASSRTFIFAARRLENSNSFLILLSSLRLKLRFERSYRKLSCSPQRRRRRMKSKEKFCRGQLGGRFGRWRICDRPREPEHDIAGPSAYRMTPSSASRASLPSFADLAAAGRAGGGQYQGNVGCQGPIFRIRFSARIFPFQAFAVPIPQQPEQFKRQGTGSGFIIRKDGLILTNNHVVENAQEITVTLSDKQQYKAKILGRDPKTDLAVIKIDPKASLPAATSR